MKLTCLRPTLAPARTTTSGWKPDTVRGSRHQRGYGTVWEKLRAQVLERDTLLCKPGLAKGEVHLAQEVDHIIPKAAGGTDHINNLQAICKACHREKTARESSKPRGEGR